MKKRFYEQFPVDYEPDLPSKQGATAPEPIKGIVVNTLLVNVRSRPDRESDVIMQLNHGDEFEILDMNGEFCKIRTHTGSVGYIVYEFCKEV